LICLFAPLPRPEFVPNSQTAALLTKLKISDPLGEAFSSTNELKVNVTPNQHRPQQVRTTDSQNAAPIVVGNADVPASVAVTVAVSDPNEIAIAMSDSSESD
jgi:hypothetical protein